MNVFRALLLLMLFSPTLTTAATYDLTLLGVPKFVNTNYIDLTRITQLTKFRSSAGHDYSDSFETCRSMKHYFMHPDATSSIFAPVTGTVTNVFPEWAGMQVQITSQAQPAFTFVIFHVVLQQPLAIGAQVQEGQVLGTHVGLQTFSDIAVRVDTPSGMRLVSYFSTLTDAAFAPFQARGIATREQMSFTREQRDAAPYLCTGDNFTSLGAPADLEYVNLTGNMPPTGSSIVTGPLNQQTISLSVTPPANVLYQTGGLFIGAFFPASRGGTIYLLSPSGAWVPFTGCATAPAYQLGQLYVGMGASVIGTPSNLTAYADVVLYVGYGIGSTWSAACTSMLNSRSYGPAYTVH